jgi:hypothetical protein
MTEEGGTTKTTVERLEELLNTKDTQIETLQAKLQAYKDQEEEENWRWTQHSKSEEKEGLPVPRLEIRWIKLDKNGYNWRAAYNLVYKHLLGDVILVPMGSTTRNGGNGKGPIRDGKVETPFRDGVHIAHEMLTLKLPGFAICDDTVTVLKPYKENPEGSREE